MCRGHATWPLWMLGYPDQARQSIRETLTLAQKLAHPFSMAIALNTAAVGHQFLREVQAVQECAEALMEVSTEQSFPQWLAYGMVLRGWALTAQGRGTEGIAQMRQGLAARRAKKAELQRPYFLGLLAEAYGEAGQAEEGLSVLAEALALAENTGERNWEAELHRQKGQLLLALPEENQIEAEACFHKAISIAHRQNAKSLELRAVMSMSRLWQQEKREEAHQLLSEIHGSFTEGFGTADFKEAQALLEELV